MFLVSLRKELLYHVLSLRYLVVFLLLISLTAACTVVRTGVYRALVADRAENRRLTAEYESRFTQWNQSKTFGAGVEREPNPLSIFAFGLENELTRTYQQGGWEEAYLGSRKLSLASFRDFVTPDFVLVVGILGSLLALALIYDSVCGEARQGTLKVVLAGPVPRDTVIAAKMAAGLLTLLVPLALAWLLSLAYVVMVGRVTFDADQAMRLGALAGLTALYLALFFALGLAISAWSAEPETSLSRSPFAWVILALVAPNLVPVFASRLAPVPARSKLVLETENISREIWDDMVPKWQEEVLAMDTYRTSSIHVWWGPEIVPRIQKEQVRREDLLWKDAGARLARQVNMCRSLGRVSPAVSFQYAACALAGTGVPDFLTLSADFDAYRYRFVQTVAELEGAARWKGREDEDREGTQYTGKLPAFVPTAPAFADTIKQLWLDIAWLAGLVCALFLAAVAGFIRYDPR